MTTPRDDNDTLLPDLRRMADEVRVRVHLAGLDAKDAWAKAEAKLHELEEKAHQAGGRAKEQLTELATTLRRDLQELIGRLPKPDGT
jgi:hypothetical protein